jgi:hypothetical protein
MWLWLRGSYDFCVSIAFFPQIKFYVDCSLLWALVIFGFCWFTELIMLAAFLALGNSFEFYSFWSLIVVNVFCPLPHEWLSWVFFVMWAWCTWTALAYPCFGWSLFLHHDGKTALLYKVFLLGSYSLRE